MKTSLIAFLCLSYFISFSQKSLIIEANVASGADRTLLSLSNVSNSTNSLASISLSSGFGATLAPSDLTTYSQTYTASPGYIGYTSLTNNASGLIFRTTTPTSNIRFLTASGVITTNTRMFIGSNGYIGIGTDTPAAKVQLKDGDLYIEDIGRGVIYKTSASTCHQLNISAAGAVSATLVTCPS